MTIRVPNFSFPKSWDLSTMGNPPQRAVVRLVDILVDSVSKKIEFKFTRSHTVDLASTSLANVFKEAGSGNYKFPEISEPGKKWPYSSPLSANNKDDAYLIYILADKNWQFARRGPPISISTIAYGKDAYFDAVRIDRMGNAIKGSDKKDDCVAASLIALTEPAFGGMNEYIDHINLHVDVRYDDATYGSLYMPLIIDPDIRFPGGSGA